MAIKKKKAQTSDPEWLNTYSDMVTLLLTFFILLFSMSSVDSQKYEELVQAFKSTTSEAQQAAAVAAASSGTVAGQTAGATAPQGGAGSKTGGSKAKGSGSMPEDFDELYQYIKAYVEEKKLSGTVDVQKGENNVFIRFRDNIFFQPNSSALQPGGTNVLNFLGDCFNHLDKQILAVRINGHTASVPNSIKTPGFDRTLSTDRANRVLVYLEETKHVNPKKLIAIGYGRNYPVASNDTEAGRSKNRRVEMMILGKNMDASSSQFVDSLLQGNYDVDMFKDNQTTGKTLIPGTSSTGKEPSTQNSAAANNTEKTVGNQEQNIEKNVSPFQKQ